LQIHSTVNILGGSRSDLYLHDSRGPEDRMTAEELEAAGKELIDWQASANLQQHAIGVGTQFTDLPGDVQERAQRIWGKAPADCVTGQPNFEGGDLKKRVSTNARDITPADFRLTKDSPGKGKGTGGKDLGADVDLVGPGKAYEAWRQTTEYQEW